MENVGNVHSVSVSALISKQYSTSEPDAFDTPVVSPIQESQVARIPSYDQANIASDVLLAAGRHPTLPHLNSAFAVLKKTLPSIFNSPVDLGTVRWDTLDPVDHSAIGGDEGSMTARTAPRIASHSVSDITAATPDYQQVGAKWRGAQIGSRPTASTGQISQTFSKKFYLALSQPLSHSVAGDRSPLLEKKMEEALAPERHTGSIMDRVAVASEKATPGNIPPPVPSRRLGKRVSEAREVIAKAPKQQERPFSSAGPSGYKIYPCKWSACQAELHNYETLVRHVMYKHKRAANGGTFSCQWDGCLIDSLGDTLSEQIPLQFSDAKEWEQHVMAHMEKVKEQLGLGPTLSETDFQPVIDFMSDRSGNPVTPLAIAAPPSYPFTPPPGYKADAEFRKARDIKYERVSRATKVFTDEMERAENISSGIEDVVEPPAGSQGWNTDYSQEIDDIEEGQDDGDDALEER